MVNENLAALVDELAFLSGCSKNLLFVNEIVWLDDDKLFIVFLRRAESSVCPVNRNSPLLGLQSQFIWEPGVKELYCPFTFSTFLKSDDSLRLLFSLSSAWSVKALTLCSCLATSEIWLSVSNLFLSVHPALTIIQQAITIFHVSLNIGRVHGLFCIIACPPPFLKISVSLGSLHISWDSLSEQQGV